jgi:hypothetical protein
MSYARSRSFHPYRIPRQHHYARALIGENLGDGLTYSHGSARNHHNLS